MHFFSTAACVLMLCGTTYAADRHLPSSDEAKIRALEDQLVEANKSKDVAAVMELYAPGTNVVIFDVVPPRQMLSQETWETNVTNYFASFAGHPDLDISDLDITVAGDMAYAHMIQRFYGKQREGGQLDITARVTDVYRKISGRWYIVHEHVSVPVNLSTGKADLESKP